MYERRPGFFRTEDAPTGRRVEAKVKWFNSAKGFGFVSLSDGTPDAFLPMAVLRRAGFEDVREGTSVTCEVGTGAKGPLVVNIMNINESTAGSPQSSRPARGSGFSNGHAGYSDGSKDFASPDHGGAEHGNARSGQPGQTLEGAVKWFEPNKGFGFIAPDGGGKDIFIHVTALRRSGVVTLDAGQRVRVDVVDGRKGLEADRITPI